MDARVPLPPGTAGAKAAELTLECSRVQQQSKVFGQLPAALGSDHSCLVELLRAEPGTTPFLVRRTLLKEGEASFQFSQLPLGPYQLQLRQLRHPNTRTLTATRPTRGQPFQLDETTHQAELPQPE